ncbi:bifunctional 2-polyprenyl-6-hydroxyphenol methylase/3-demethylubiquinol 3-O-methyltransferase UbiG [Glaciecola sp. MH2013]|uniref:bifunctional 2-polyprenyl-6-hydroxyphenol methylase/3-demethylubiquinol 3-O-methyltransferase UbiG n=1 Tax=Glaciecola sp. MH2013 TaxID=2785524 RepID=UPI00189CBF47|nr:bifunctional 2-polyprenyl-6-hydroxyphenol methylase/3-demethylubiquinol 3-O-methyltransferase UbiG [Glaciecola sp. MH2013]MBF7072864.1 bifunctional 2-polyprenyl-6-hydroxyphenol methylase/3-demethylubiquinol 3-O-methyltransferase UbiG [Glaciecola sp. MH2013]
MAELNVDDQEIEKFSALASKWWDKQGEFKPLHDINPVRLGFIEEKAKGLFDKSVLDVGCGGGILAEAMAASGANVQGIDLAQESLKVATLHGLESGINVTYTYSAAEDFAKDHAQYFDVVTCLEMLEHVPDPCSVVLACAEMVKPGGSVFFSTINRNTKSWLMAILGAEYILNLVPKGTHSHNKFIRPSELSAWTEKTELVQQEITGLHLNPLTATYYLSDKNVDVNYMMHCIKPI